MILDDDTKIIPGITPLNQLRYDEFPSITMPFVSELVGDGARPQGCQYDPGPPEVPSHGVQFGELINVMTRNSKVMIIVIELHEIQQVMHPSNKDQGIQPQGRTTILNPTTTIADILEKPAFQKDLLVDFRLRAIPRVS